MMRRIWAAIAAAWAVIAVFGVLALTQRPAVSGTSGTTVVMARTARDAGADHDFNRGARHHFELRRCSPGHHRRRPKRHRLCAVLYVKNPNGTFVPVVSPAGGSFRRP